MSLFSDLKSAVFGSPITLPQLPLSNEGNTEAHERSPNLDVAIELDAKAKEFSGDLNWRTSIVDLMKLLKMNEWLREQVLARLAEQSAGDTDAWAGPDHFPGTEGMC